MATAVRTSSLWRLERCDAVYLEESDVSRENIASIFSVREQFKQETSRSRRQANQKTVFFIVSNVRS
jgi:phage portal protein BeeE